MGMIWFIEIFFKNHQEPRSKLSKLLMDWMKSEWATEIERSGPIGRNAPETKYFIIGLAGEKFQKNFFANFLRSWFLDSKNARKKNLKKISKFFSAQSGPISQSPSPFFLHSMAFLSLPAYSAAHVDRTNN